MLKAGIVGLPNVGKSTLFNAITKQDILAANYPFATIDPNVGVVNVPDKRMNVLNDMYMPERLILASFEFTDIAGLVKGASTGEGLGNKFLSHIREVDAIVEVVRCFDDSNIIHVEGTPDPVRDVEIINLELTISDLEIVNNRLSKIEKKAMTTKDADSLIETPEGVGLTTDEEGNVTSTIPASETYSNISQEIRERMIEGYLSSISNYKKYNDMVNSKQKTEEVNAHIIEMEKVLLKLGYSGSGY